MPKPRSKYRQFVIIVLELFIALKVYQLVEQYDISMRLFFVIAFVMYWVLNWIFAKLELTRGLDNTLVFKVLPRTSYDNDWFGILSAAAVFIGFGFGEFLGMYGSLVLLILITAFLSYFVYRFVFNYDNILKHSWGLVLLGFVIGMAFGYPFTNGLIIVVIFLLSYVVMYLSQDPGEG